MEKATTTCSSVPTRCARAGVWPRDPDGKYWFRSIKPFYYPVPADGPVGSMLAAMGRHPNRPGHIHFIVSASGYKSIVTHLFPSDGPYLDSDVVFGVKQGLIVDFKRHEPGMAPTGEQVDVPFWTCNTTSASFAANSERHDTPSGPAGSQARKSGEPRRRDIESISIPGQFTDFRQDIGAREGAGHSSSLRVADPIDGRISTAHF
ncbi:hypothetical protein [Paraburkholderia tuberum]|uniref:dioxygenase family protein n=1 Tax=Paraburkholderia tuberum TaxID=157910 RepID=UPI003132C59B